MLKFFLDKIRESPGPLKQARLVAADMVEEIVDLVAHYIHPKRPTSESAEYAPKPEESTGTPAAEPEIPPVAENKKAPARSGAATKKKSTKAAAAPSREVEISADLARAIETPGNQKKQEFKVLAILWDAQTRGMKELSANSVSEHGLKLGLIIRHENVRKVIRMQLGDYVESAQNRKAGTSIYHYRITEKGAAHFEEKYLQK